MLHDLYYGTFFLSTRTKYSSNDTLCTPLSSHGRHRRNPSNDDSPVDDDVKNHTYKTSRLRGPDLQLHASLWSNHKILRRNLICRGSAPSGRKTLGILGFTAYRSTREVFLCNSRFEMSLTSSLAIQAWLIYPHELLRPPLKFMSYNNTCYVYITVITADVRQKKTHKLTFGPDSVFIFVTPPVVIGTLVCVIRIYGVRGGKHYCGPFPIFPRAMNARGKYFRVLASCHERMFCFRWVTFPQILFL